MLPCVCLFSDRSQMTLKCGKIKEVAHESQASVSLMFLPLLLNIPVFVLYNDQKRIKTDTHTGRLVSLDCSTICASLDILKSQTATLRLRLFFFSSSYL